ncbi:MAG: S1-like domain-containing RNA-binding protein [Bacteroidales bacterium]|jgi:predicted RNA-binding protein (virulence factor B family)|nr:S1-like domain-containing RNA-binding protein [Bacteroidales bacterium]
MAELGKINKLQVVREVDFGFYLDGGNEGEILFPKKYVPENCAIDDFVDVFVYLDSEDRPVATTEEPYAVVGDFALLKAVAVNPVGGFLDWGVLKDLLVPYSEQKIRFEEGKSYLVKIYIDEESNRIVASSEIEKFLDAEASDFEEGQEVDIIIVNKTDLGYKAIINNSYLGLVYKNEVFQNLERGKHYKGYIKNIRTDGKIDLSMQKSGYEQIDDFSKKIIQTLNDNDGFVALTDKSSPEDIYEKFGVSKKVFKKSVGALYKKRLITIESDGIKIK